jgi:uncharacterized protein YlbG (UPF0298 family)
MAKSNLHAGNFNLRGKKYKLLYCRCCTVQDFRDKLKKKEVIKEMKEVHHD